MYECWDSRKLEVESLILDGCGHACSEMPKCNQNPYILKRLSDGFIIAQNSPQWKIRHRHASVLVIPPEESWDYWIS